MITQDNLSTNKRLALAIVNSPAWLDCLEARMHLAPAPVKRGRIDLRRNDIGWLASFAGVSNMPDATLPLPFTAAASLDTVATDILRRFPQANVYCRQS